jgi:hypothetical protein
MGEPAPAADACRTKPRVGALGGMCMVEKKGVVSGKANADDTVVIAQ